MFSLQESIPRNVTWPPMRNEGGDKSMAGNGPLQIIIETNGLK